MSQITLSKRQPERRGLPQARSALRAQNVNNNHAARTVQVLIVRAFVFLAGQAHTVGSGAAKDCGCAAVKVGKVEGGQEEVGPTGSRPGYFE